MLELMVMKKDLEGEVLEIRFVEITEKKLQEIWLDDMEASKLAGFELSDDVVVEADFYEFCEEY